MCMLPKYYLTFNSPSMIPWTLFQLKMENMDKPSYPQNKTEEIIPFKDATAPAVIGYSKY